MAGLRVGTRGIASHIETGGGRSTQVCRFDESTSLMLGRLGRLSVLVDDHDEAIEFYVDRLGFEVLYDGSLDDGTRLVHLELPTQRGSGVWLFEADGEEQRERVGNQTGGAPLGVFYTDDCRGVAEQLEERGVDVGEVRESSDDVSVHFEDCHGNRFVLVELKE